MRRPPYERTEQDHLTMMLNPDRWPRWPALALKRDRPDADGFPYQLAVLLATGDPGAPIFLTDTNLFNIPPDAIEKAPRVSPADLIRDGWIVD